MKLGAFVRPYSSAESNFHASPGHVVQNRNVLGKPYRMPPRGYVGHLTNTNSGSPSRQVRTKQDWIWDVSHRIGTEVVLPKPHGLEAKLLGQDGLLSKVVQQANGAGGFSGRSCNRREGVKSHSCNLLVRQDNCDFRSN